MSYILEALKKSQAERQLGAVPTIDAAPIYGGAGQAPLNKPLWLALGALALMLALLLWRELHAPAFITQAAPAAQPDAPEVAQAPKAESRAVPKAAPEAVNVVEAPKAANVVEAAKVANVVEAAKVANVIEAANVAKAVEAPNVAKAAAPAAPVVASETSVPALRELPEPIQRQIPALAIGGYIYSKNPADRLLLVDKALRREGDEVAPGLMLEKLQPEAAIFNYRGYRYRAPY